MYIREVTTMKLGKQLKVLVTKKGRIYLEVTGSKWDVFEQLSEKVSGLTGRITEIEHESDCTFNIYVEGEHIAWVGDGLTTYEIYIFEEVLQRLLKEQGYRIQLVEA